MVLNVMIMFVLSEKITTFNLFLDSDSYENTLELIHNSAS